MPHFCSKGVCPASPALHPRQPRICPEKASEPRVTLVLNLCFKSCVQLFVLKPGLSVVTQGCCVVWVNGFLLGPALHSVTLFRANAWCWPPVHLAWALTPVRPLPTHWCHSPSRAACPEPDLAWLPLQGDSLLSSRAPRPDIFRPSFRTGSRPGHHAPFSSLSTSPAPYLGPSFPNQPELLHSWHVSIQGMILGFFTFQVPFFIDEDLWLREGKSIPPCHTQRVWQM